MGIFSSVADIIMPPRCVFCRGFVRSSADLVCTECRDKLGYTENGGAQRKDFFDCCVSPLYYEGATRQSLLRFKFRGATAYAKVYGDMIAECVKENLAGQYDLISWVPLSKKHYRERGYDQSMLLAMAAALELDDVAVSTLEKHINSVRQSQISSEEQRRANVSGVYRVTDGELVRGRRILLIDDIITTGATLSECARMLRMAGAEAVVCATLARARD